MLVLALAGSWQAAEPVRDLRDFSGGAVLLDRIARHIEVDGVVVLPSVLDGSNSGRLAAPLWASRGISAAVLDLTTPDERALKPLFDAWSKRGHGIYYVLQNGADPPDVAGYHAELLGEEGWISRALAPVSLLPAHGTEVSLELDIYRYNTGDFGQ
jgi:hypothetical protein